MDIKNLSVQGIISFNGTIKNALKLHQDEKHILYPMGNNIVIKNIESGSQKFLTGHTNQVTAVCISPCGKFVASGQINHLGFKAPVIIWDFDKLEATGRYEIHKVKVEDVFFSCQSNYVVSLGGIDDGNLLVWDMKTKHLICGTTASTDISGHTFKIINTNLREQCFISGGENIIKLWRIDSASRKLDGFDIKLGKVKRQVNVITVDGEDKLAYCGTSTGDIIMVRLNFSQNIECLVPIYPPVMVDCYCKISKNLKKRQKDIGDLYEGGINALLMYNNNLIVGAGDGTIELIEIIQETKKSSANKGNNIKAPSKPRIKTVYKLNYE